MAQGFYYGDADRKRIERQQALVDALAQQKIAPEGRMVSGHYVAPGWGGALAEALGGALRGYQRKTLDDESKALEGRTQQAEQDFFANIPQGTPEVPMRPGTLPQEVPAQTTPQLDKMGEDAVPAFTIPGQEPVLGAPAQQPSQQEMLKYYTKGMSISPATNEVSKLGIVQAMKDPAEDWTVVPTGSINKRTGEHRVTDFAKEEARTKHLNIELDNKRADLALAQARGDKEAARALQLQIAEMMDATRRQGQAMVAGAAADRAADRADRAADKKSTDQEKKLDRGVQDLSDRAMRNKIPDIESAMAPVENMLAGTEEGKAQGVGGAYNVVPARLAAMFDKNADPDVAANNQRMVDGFKQKMIVLSSGLAQTNSELANTLKSIALRPWNTEKDFRAAVKDFRDAVNNAKGTISAGFPDDVVNEFDNRRGEKVFSRGNAGDVTVIDGVTIKLKKQP